MSGGIMSVSHRDWVDATDFCRLCDLMMMIPLQRCKVVTYTRTPIYTHTDVRTEPRDTKSRFAYWQRDKNALIYVIDGHGQVKLMYDA